LVWIPRAGTPGARYCFDRLGFDYTNRRLRRPVSDSWFRVPRRRPTRLAYRSTQASSGIIPIGVCANRYQTLGFARRRRPTRLAYRSTQVSSGISRSRLCSQVRAGRLCWHVPRQTGLAHWALGGDESLSPRADIMAAFFMTLCGGRLSCTERGATHGKPATNGCSAQVRCGRLDYLAKTSSVHNYLVFEGIQ
jgi:hypothetical protein